jgi:prephenate dehydrogenase
MTRTLGIAGVGLIGGSIALRAHAAGWTTVGFDRDATALAAARAAGALDAVAPDLAQLAARCEVVAIALPIDATIAALRDVAEFARPALVFDVGSVKAPIAAAGAHVPNFIASHPLAGREIGGFAAAEAGLFDGRAWVYDPAGAPAARELLLGLIAALGARAVALAPADHDRLVAVTSHLPQALAVALGARLAATGAADARAYDVCGPGIASMLRLARSPLDLWSTIFSANAEPLAAELRALALALEAVARALDEGDVATLASYFADAGSAVAALERTDGPQRSSPYAVPTR